MKFLVDPTSVTNYNCSYEELELLILWWILAAGKNGVTSARCLDALLNKWEGKLNSPFEIIKRIDKQSNLPVEMKNQGIGCYNNKAKSFKDLISKNLDLKRCSLEELEAVRGIGPKTARCFLLHSRKGQRYAGLDTHALSYMRDLGFNVPKSTPVAKKYKELEQTFLQLADISGISAADFDLMIWNVYSGRNKDKKSMDFLSSLKERAKVL